MKPDKKIEEIIEKYINEFSWEECCCFSEDQHKENKGECLNKFRKWSDDMYKSKDWLRQILLEYQQEVREETLRNCLFKKCENNWNNSIDYNSGFINGYCSYYDEIISKAKELYNLEIE